MKPSEYGVFDVALETDEGQARRLHGGGRERKVLEGSLQQTKRIVAGDRRSRVHGGLGDIVLNGKVFRDERASPNVLNAAIEETKPAAQHQAVPELLSESNPGREVQVLCVGHRPGSLLRCYAFIRERSEEWGRKQGKNLRSGQENSAHATRSRHKVSQLSVLIVHKVIVVIAHPRSSA